MHYNLRKFIFSGSFIIMAALMIMPMSVFANEPYLAFSDLISGPDTGIGDGLGSGVIVTVWGQDLGHTQGDNKIYFTDANDIKREAAHVYYWKNADGSLPSGPANLYASHRMQEIAFSIPDSANGTGTIHIETNEASNKIPFTIRAGNIYHVKNSGNDTADGSWESAWLTVAKADSTAPAGSTIYIHDVNTGSASSQRGIYWNNSSANSALANQFSVVAYPSFHPTVTGQQGVLAYNVDAMVVSKLDIYASNYTATDANGQPTGPTIWSGSTFGIFTTKNGRAVANKIGDIPGGCASKYQGAIVGTADFHDYVSNYKILGNEVYDYGCNGSTKLHHTTYMTIRSGPDNLQITPWEFGYNYLHGNKAKFGIHQFDQDEGCGDLTGVLRIYNNVIVDQAGSGINVASQCGWSMDVEIENNVLINVGLAADWDGIDPATANGAENGGISIGDSPMTGTMYIRNNLVFNWASDANAQGMRGCLGLAGRDGDDITVIWSNNICYTEHDRPFMGAGYRAELKFDNVFGNNNIWYDAAGSTSNDNIPAGVTNSLLLDPKLIFDGIVVALDETSPAINGGVNLGVSSDIYGRARQAIHDIGPVEYLSTKASPSPPSNILILVD